MAWGRRVDETPPNIQFTTDQVDLGRLEDLVERLEVVTDVMAKTGFALDRTIDRANKTVAALHEAANRAELAARFQRASRRLG